MQHIYRMIVSHKPEWSEKNFLKNYNKIETHRSEKIKMKGKSENTHVELR